MHGLVAGGWLLLLMTGCSVHQHGILEPTRGGARLVTADGEVHRLLLLGEAAPLGRLDGHFVRIEGTRILGRVRVTDWAVVEGVHGMTAWAGTLAVLGVQVGIHDRGSGGFYWLDEAAARALRGHVGEVVLVEGYVDGPHRVTVRYFRLLERQRSAVGDPRR